MLKFISYRKLMLSLLIGLAVTGMAMQYISSVKADIEDSVVRFHVLANSNSDDDQQLKLKVRDAVICYLKGKLSGAQSTDETVQIIQAELQNIATVSKEEIYKNGYAYSVTAQLGNFDFPSKQYGDAQLPAGKYDALRIVIGSGEGNNWWCVLFPQLCFISNPNGSLSDESKQKLKNVLTVDEYNIVANSKDGNVSVKIKFRLLEIFGR